MNVLNVLVVDDYPGTRDCLVSYLRGEGFKAVGTDNATDAVALLRNDGLCGMFLDMEFLGPDGQLVKGIGLDVIREARQLKGPDFPIVAMSCRNSYMEPALESGATSFIEKPINDFDMLYEFCKGFRQYNPNRT